MNTRESMRPERDATWDDEKRQLYFQFSRYRQAAGDFCSLCYTQEEVVVLMSTAPDAIGSDFAHRLLWEACDHWSSPEMYRRYLPRILSALAPPEQLEYLYPRHVFEVLAHQQFASWPDEEQEQTLHFLARLLPVIEDRSLDDATEWRSALKSLRAESLALPAGRGGSSR